MKSKRMILYDPIHEQSSNQYYETELSICSDLCHTVCLLLLWFALGVSALGRVVCCAEFDLSIVRFFGWEDESVLLGVGITQINGLSNLPSTLCLLCTKPSAFYLLLTNCYVSCYISFRGYLLMFYIFFSSGKFKDAFVFSVFENLDLLLKLTADVFQTITFFGLLFIGCPNRVDLVFDGLIVKSGRFYFRLHLFDLSFERKALLLEKAKLGGKLDDILIPLDFNIDVSIGLLRQYQVVAHFLEYVHEHLDEVFFLLVFVFVVEPVKLHYFLQDAVVKVLQVVWLHQLRRKALFAFDHQIK